MTTHRFFPLAAIAALLLVLLLPRPGQAQVNLTAQNQAATVTINNSIATASFQISGTFVGTVTFEATTDGQNWVTVSVLPPGGPGTAVTTATAAGLWRLQVAGFLKARARCSAYTSGTIVVTARTSLAAWTPGSTIS
jgi:predicted secreted protein